MLRLWDVVASQPGRRPFDFTAHIRVRYSTTLAALVHACKELSSWAGPWPLILRVMALADVLTSAGLMFCVRIHCAEVRLLWSYDLDTFVIDRCHQL